MPLLTRRLWGGIDRSEKILLAAVPINIQTVEFACIMNGRSRFVVLEIRVPTLPNTYTQER